LGGGDSGAALFAAASSAGAGAPQGYEAAQAQASAGLQKAPTRVIEYTRGNLWTPAQRLFGGVLH